MFYSYCVSLDGVLGTDAYIYEKYDVHELVWPSKNNNHLEGLCIWLLDEIISIHNNKNLDEVVMPKHDFRTVEEYSDQVLFELTEIIIKNSTDITQEKNLSFNKVVYFLLRHTQLIVLEEFKRISNQEKEHGFRMHHQNGHRLINKSIKCFRSELAQLKQLENSDSLMQTAEILGESYLKNWHLKAMTFAKNILA